jgi:hypothetical protein
MNGIQSHKKTAPFNKRFATMPSDTAAISIKFLVSIARTGEKPMDFITNPNEKFVFSGQKILTSC